MPRRPARFTQADVARAIRAAKEADAGPVRVLPDGTICIDVQVESDGGNPRNMVDTDEDITL